MSLDIPAVDLKIVPDQMAGEMPVFAFLDVPVYN